MIRLIGFLVRASIVTVALFFLYRETGPVTVGLLGAAYLFWEIGEYERHENEIHRGDRP